MSQVASSNSFSAAGRVETLDDLYREAGRLDMRAGWVKYPNAPAMTSSPRSRFVPMHWRYSDAKPALDVAGRLMDTSQAERRNLILSNSTCVGGLDALRTLMCAYQLILPGEVARAHRHTAHALRVILDAQGSFSIVNGKKHLMETGDVVLTPGGHWHEHGHDGAEPAYWIDILDVPLTCLFETWRFEPHPAHFQEKVEWAEASPFLFSAASIAARLEKAEADPHGFYGPRIALEAPMMPTLGLSVERLAAGSATRGYTSNANHLFCVMRGSGVSTVEGETYRWNRGDIIAAPAWNRIAHRADSDAQIFTCSDEPMLRFANYYTFKEA
jgi:gentisate 1,2-dioxygenase